MATLAPRSPVTRGEYYKLTATDEYQGSRTELIHGEVAILAPPGPEHSSIVERIRNLLYDAVGSSFSVRQEQPLIVGADTEPQPDIVVCSGPAGSYARIHPTAADALLVIEVADSSRTRDTQAKLALYATARIAQYWIVHVLAQTVSVYTGPAAGAYTDHRSMRAGDSIPLSMAPGSAISVAKVFGP